MVEVKKMKPENEEDNKISLEEHILIGKALKIINRKVLDSTKYKTKREYRKSYERKAFDLGIKLQDVMEEILFKQYPEKPTTSIYYGTLEEQAFLLDKQKNEKILS